MIICSFQSREGGKCLSAASRWLVVAEDEGNEIPAATLQHKLDIPDNASCSIILRMKTNHLSFWKKGAAMGFFAETQALLT